MFNYKITVQLAGNEVVNPLWQRKNVNMWQIAMGECTNEAKKKQHFSINRCHFVCARACMCVQLCMHETAHHNTRSMVSSFWIKMFFPHKTCSLAHTNSPQYIPLLAHAHCAHTQICNKPVSYKRLTTHNILINIGYKMVCMYTMPTY